MTFSVIQGHCCCHHLIGHILFPISLSLQVYANLAQFSRKFPHLPQNQRWHSFARVLSIFLYHYIPDQVTLSLIPRYATGKMVVISRKMNMQLNRISSKTKLSHAVTARSLRTQMRLLKRMRRIFIHCIVTVDAIQLALLCTPITTKPPLTISSI